MDFNLTDEKTMFVTTFQILNRRAKEKYFVKSFFGKSPRVYEDFKKLHARFFCKIKNSGRKKVGTKLR